IAAQINPGADGARRPPLNLMVGRPAGYRGLDFISYSQAGRAVQAINNPWNAYSEFINLDNSSPDSGAANDRIALRRQSVLDLVREQFDDLKLRGLSSEDQRKLDAHFTAIRSIELQVGAGGLGCGDPALETRARGYENMAARDIERETNYPLIADLQIDILALALACGYTRVGTMHFDRGSGGPTFKW